MKKAWLVRCGFRDQNEDECLKRLGIKEKIIDVISIRKDFCHITEIAKDVYIRQRLSVSEKIYLSNYAKGKKRKEELFSRQVPISTHYHSVTYRNFVRALEEGRSDDVKRLLDQLSKLPQYITVGHNPYLEIIKVFNLSVFEEDEDGREIIEWDCLLTDGILERERYERKK